MNILVLAWDIPATTNMPGSPRLFNLCKYFSRQNRQTLVTFNLDEERRQAFLSDPEVDGVFEDIVILDNSPEPSWGRRQLHRLRREVHFVTRYHSPEFHARQCERIGNLFVKGGFDAVYVDALYMAQYVMDAELDCPAVIDLHDCMSLLFSRLMRAEPNWLRKLVLLDERRNISRWEKSLSRRFSAVITNSAVDEAYLRSLDRSGNIFAIGNGVDCEFFTPSGDPGVPTKLIFTGVMDYDPNEDAAIYFCNTILPLIQDRYPMVEFWVVGKNPTDRVQALAKRTGVHVTGGVPDMRPFLESAGIFVCPLRFGSGVKNKILAALAMEKAVVATPLSLEGLELREEEQVIVGDEPEKFAAQVIRLIEDPALAERLARNGRSFVRSNYSWESSAARIEVILQDAVKHYESGDRNSLSDRLSRAARH